MDRLIRLARQRLANQPRRIADEEDVAIRVFNGFLEGVHKARFVALSDRNDLWSILLMLTERRTIDQIRKKIVRRDSILGESAIAGDDDTNRPFDRLDSQSAPTPTPEFIVDMTERCRYLLESLDDKTLREVAILKMEGYTIEQISIKFGVVRRTIDRKLNRIRQLLDRTGMWGQRTASTET